MSSNLFRLVTLFSGFYLLAILPLVDAALFVVKPSAGTLCHGGHPCTVTWLDDGSSPLLTAIGPSFIGLYTGKQQLVQTLFPVDVSSTLSFTFKPDPAAGPNSNAYYIGFTSTQAKINGTQPYVAYSPWFCLEGMTGSFDNPLPSATHSIPIPSSLTLRPSSTVLSTVTVGTLSTAIPTLSMSVSLAASTPSTRSSSSSPSSRLVTSVIPSPSATSPSASGSSAPPSGSSNSAVGNMLPYLSFSIAAVVAVVLGQ